MVLSNAGTTTGGVTSVGVEPTTGTLTCCEGTVSDGRSTGTTGSGRPGTSIGVPAGAQTTNAHTVTGTMTPVETGSVGPVPVDTPGVLWPPTGMTTPPIVWPGTAAEATSGT